MNWRQTILLIVCLAAGGCASYVEGPNWAGPMRSSAGMRLFPPLALRDDKSAVVGLSCWMAADGRLTECKVGYVSTPGYGFEEAALRVAGDIVIQPREARIVVAANVERATASHGGGWAKQPVFFATTPMADRELVRLWQAEGKAATERFAANRPDRHG